MRNSRPIRVPDHPPLLDAVGRIIGSKSVHFRFTGTREEAQAILDQLEAKAKAIALSTVGPEIR